MVNGIPKLSLPSDLPYKKRQRPFNPNAPLQQATIRYNEALRKHYNDVQFAKRCENGYIPQNDLISVNTIDIVKNVEADFFHEMSNLSPLPIVRQRKSKKIFICAGNSTGEIPSSLCNSSRYYSSSPILDKCEGVGVTGVTPAGPASCERENVQIDCNNTEMFPHLLSTVGNGSSSSGSLSSHVPNQPQSEKTSAPYLSRCMNNKCPSTLGMSLEDQGIISEYEPNMYGNVMGLDYGNYLHGHLWPTPQQSSNNDNSLGAGNFQHFNPQQNHPTFLHPHPSHICGASKSVGFNLPSSVHHHMENHVDYDSGIITVSPLTNIGNHSAQYSGSGRRSTSVPRPRTGTRKETMKQAAIRCGIIKGNQTVPAIPKRSLCLFPFQLTPVPVQSDPAMPVVEILHPRPLIPTGSSEALMDEGNRLAYITSLKSSSKVGKVEDDKEKTAAAEIPSEERNAFTQIRSVTDIRTVEEAVSSDLLITF